jgi:sigma-B regulation protein RsbU (phosphoserine phosphatase)
MQTTESLRRQLEDRRGRLRSGISADGSERDLVLLLEQVDAALTRFETGEYGRCLICHESVLEEDLGRNPLLEYCLCNLTREQQRALEHDLELARRLQSGLLPDPDVAVGGWRASYGYEPAGVVSGDYCDLWVRSDEADTVYFAVGDVTGKGVAASLLMSHIQAAFRALAEAETPLADLVGRVNRQLLRAEIPSHYATLVCGRAGADGRVEIVNAGHCPPLVARGGAVDAVGPTGYPIGLVGEHLYDVTHLALEEGDTLVLYSDGLTEARGPGGEEYGQERLESLLSRRTNGTTPRSLVRAIRGDLIEFLGGSEHADDLTLLVLRRGRL